MIPVILSIILSGGAIQAQENKPTAVALALVSPSGRPWSLGWNEAVWVPQKGDWWYSNPEAAIPLNRRGTRLTLGLNRGELDTALKTRYTQQPDVKSVSGIRTIIPYVGVSQEFWGAQIKDKVLVAPYVAASAAYVGASVSGTEGVRNTIPNSLGLILEAGIRAMYHDKLGVGIAYEEVLERIPGLRISRIKASVTIVPQNLINLD